MTREETARIVKEVLEEAIKGCCYLTECDEDWLTAALEALQERPRGRWHTLHETKLTKTVECTHCNTPFRYQKKGNIIVDDFYYCPNCGQAIERSDIQE